MRPPLHHRLYRIGLALGLAAGCGLALVGLLDWDGLPRLPETVGDWLAYVLDAS